MRITKRQVKFAIATLTMLIAAYVSYTKQVPDGMSGESASVPARVIKVVDGDTIEVTVSGSKEKVRIIGIDTPETVDPRKPVQCFGSEASANAHRLMDGAAIKLVDDPSQHDRDKYGRLLRYVTLPDGSDYGLNALESGFASEYTYNNVPYVRSPEYRTAAKDAQKSKRGLWADDTCAGDTSQAAKQTASN